MVQNWWSLKIVLHVSLNDDDDDDDDDDDMEVMENLQLDSSGPEVLLLFSSSLSYT